MADAPLLEARSVSKRFGPVVALRAAGLVVRPARRMRSWAPTAPGKSTLVKILTGVLRSDTGTIRIAGTDARVASPAHAARIGLAPVFQDPALVPDLTVAQNLRLTQTPRR